MSPWRGKTAVLHTHPHMIANSTPQRSNLLSKSKDNIENNSNIVRLNLGEWSGVELSRVEEIRGD